MADRTRAQGNDEAEDAAAGALQRLDKWLWFARVVKSRSQAAELVRDGGVRLNRDKVEKPSHAVRAGDVITVAVNARVRVLEVRAPGLRRGPASEAALLYADLTPKPSADETRADSASQGRRERGTGRPTKKERRLMDRLFGEG